MRKSWRHLDMIRHLMCYKFMIFNSGGVKPKNMTTQIRRFKSLTKWMIFSSAANQEKIMTDNDCSQVGGQRLELNIIIMWTKNILNDTGQEKWINKQDVVVFKPDKGCRQRVWERQLSSSLCSSSWTSSGMMMLLLLLVVVVMFFDALFTNWAEKARISFVTSYSHHNRI